MARHGKAVVGGSQVRGALPQPRRAIVVVVDAVEIGFADDGVLLEESQAGAGIQGLVGTGEVHKPAAGVDRQGIARLALGADDSRQVGAQSEGGREAGGVSVAIDSQRASGAGKLQARAGRVTALQGQGTSGGINLEEIARLSGAAVNGAGTGAALQRLEAVAGVWLATVQITAASATGDPRV